MALLSPFKDRSNSVIGEELPLILTPFFSLKDRAVPSLLYFMFLIIIYAGDPLSYIIL